MFHTPILFLIFNRPDTTRQSFERIAKVKPKFLYIAADGARPGMIGEEEICEETRHFVLNAITWDCEVNTLMRVKNLGCGRAVSEAINWFFSHVKEGIIIEDDILASPLFFDFASLMLNKYRDDKRILSIGGFNFGFNQPHPFLSRFFNMWGWATWRDRAMNVDYQMKNWNHKSVESKYIFLNSALRENFKIDVFWRHLWLKRFNELDDKPLYTWDYQWVYWGLQNKMYSILASRNLIQNIGFGHHSATHAISNISSLECLVIDRFEFVDLEKLAGVNLQFENEKLKKSWCNINTSKFEQFWFSNLKVYYRKLKSNLIK